MRDFFLETGKFAGSNLALLPLADVRELCATRQHWTGSVMHGAVRYRLAELQPKAPARRKRGVAASNHPSRPG